MTLTGCPVRIGRSSTPSPSDGIPGETESAAATDPQDFNLDGDPPRSAAVPPTRRPDGSRPAHPPRPRSRPAAVGGVQGPGRAPIRAAVRYRQVDPPRPRRRRSAQGLRFSLPAAFVHQPSCPERDPDQGRPSARPPFGPRDDVGGLHPRPGFRPRPRAGRTARPDRRPQPGPDDDGDVWEDACPHPAHRPCLWGTQRDW